nr:hypothetical protein [Tanacetum cinerariifolium]
MTENLKLLINFVWKFMGTIRFGNDHVAAISRSKDEAPKLIKTLLKKIQVLLQAPVIIIRTDNGTEFTNQDKKDIMLVQVYVDDIIFGSTKNSWCGEFEALMKNRFQMSSMDELTFLLGLQVKQKKDGTFISQDKYVAEILKKFDFLSVKTASTPIETKKPLVKDKKAADMDVHLYRSMIDSLMYVTASRPDIMYAVCACSRFQVTPKTSHLQAMKRIFRHHFIRDAYGKKLIQGLKIHTDDNVADLLTKAFDVSRFNFLIVNIRQKLSTVRPKLNTARSELNTARKKSIFSKNEKIGLEKSNKNVNGWKEKFNPDSKGNPTTATQKEIRDQLNAEAEAVQIILTGIDNDIYSTVDACPNACEMWKAIERLKQGESINVQDLETNLFWEFRKFTSLDSESLESYYSRFYKMMDELTRNQCNVTTHQVNVQFLLQLQPEWQRTQAATRNRGKAIVNSPQPIYDQEPSMVDDDEDTSKDKEIDKLMALISLSFKKIYKPTNNDLRTSSNTSRANQDNSPMIHRNAGYKSQRSGNVAGARETVGSSMKPKRAKDAAYHREKMLLCKQEEARIQLNAEQADWKDDTDDESADQELEAHYIYMAKIQEVSPDAVDTGPIFDK